MFLLTRREFWKTPALAVGAILAIIGVVLLPPLPHSPFAPRRAAVSPKKTVAPPSVTLPAPSPVAALMAVSPPRKASAPPLTITLVSSEKNSRVRVGASLTFTAVAALTQGHSAKIALSFQRGTGPKTRFSFAQGILCSAAWTPPAPGQYTFTATALDDHRQTALSRRLQITAEAAPPPQRFSPAALFHVAAARFPHAGKAAILANALKIDGLRAKVQALASSAGQVSYVVETGSYPNEQAAQKQSLALQRIGYPAFYFNQP